MTSRELVPAPGRRHTDGVILKTVSAAFCLIVVLTGADFASGAGLRAKVGSQAIQNEKADGDNLSRMEDAAMTARWVRLELLEPVSSKTSTYYLHQVPAGNRYLRPWAKLFLSRLSRQYKARFGKPLRISSLLRSAEYQRTLQRRNGNAAAASGPKRSTHLTGAGLDISKKGMPARERAWLRGVLGSLRDKGYLYAIEEFQQPNFHIMVYREYEGYVQRKLTAAR